MAERPDLKSQRLQVRLPPNWPSSKGALEWEWSGPAAQKSGVVQTVSDLPASFKDIPLDVWSPGEDTLLAQAVVPTKNRFKVRQALPFALEDQLLDETDQLAFAYQPTPQKNALAVAVTAKDQIKTWLAPFKEQGFRPTGLCPDTLRIPYTEGAWSVHIEKQKIRVRTGLAEGFVCLTQDRGCPYAIQSALTEAKENNNAPGSLLIYGAPRHFDWDRWGTQTGLPVQAGSLTEKEAPLPLNMLQGEFAPRLSWGPLIQKWKPALVVLGLWLVGSFVFHTAQWIHFKQKIQSQNQQMVTLFRQTFPQAKALVNPALQMERNWKALKSRGGELSEGDLLSLLTQATPALSADSQVRLENFQYEDAGLTLAVSAPDFKNFEALEKELRKQALQTTILEADRKDGQVQGRILVQARGSL